MKVSCGLASAVVLAALVGSSSFASAANVVDGVFGSEWAGSSAKVVGYDAAAPESNFSTPTNVTRGTGYSVYGRGDANYAYFALQSAGTVAGGNSFANLYFSTAYPSTTTPYLGLSIGTNGTLSGFTPGTAGTFDVSSFGIEAASTTTGAGTTVEVAIPWAAIQAVPQYNFQGSLAITLSQSFGYSVGGGSSYTGGALAVASITTAAVPLPMAAMSGGSLLACMTLGRRRRMV